MPNKLLLLAIVLAFPMFGCPTRKQDKDKDKGFGPLCHVAKRSGASSETDRTKRFQIIQTWIDKNIRNIDILVIFGQWKMSLPHERTLGLLRTVRSQSQDKDCPLALEFLPEALEEIYTAFKTTHPPFDVLARLEELALDTPEIRALLYEALHDEALRSKAADVLQKLRLPASDPRPKKSLAELQKDTEAPDVFVRSQAAWALGRMLEQARPALPYLLHLAQNHKARPAQYGALWALRHLGPIAKDITPALSTMAQGKLGRPLREQIGRTLRAIQQDPKK